MSGIEAYLALLLQSLLALAPRAVAGLVVFLGLTLLGRGVSRVLLRSAEDGHPVGRTAVLTARLVRGVFALVGFTIALQILGLTGLAASLFATGGLLAVVLGFAFREIGENLLAGVFLGFSRSFEVGDLIESSGHRGEVRDIRLRHVHLRASDGRDVFIPCASIFSDVLINYTRDHVRRGEFEIGVDYGTPLADALARLSEAVRGTEGTLEDPAPTCVISTFEAQYVTLRAMFWVRTDRRPGLSSVRSDAMLAGWTALKSAGYTVSADVTSGLVVAPLDVRLAPRPSTGRDEATSHDEAAGDDEVTGLEESTNQPAEGQGGTHRME